MMTVPMDKDSHPSSEERVKRFNKKNAELENSRRRSAQARIPSDPNAWQNIRENFEAMILQDHVSSEQHEIEYALWQLHYKRMEELRAHLSAALASASRTSPTEKDSMRPSRITKIRSQLKTFLSEASGFYHDLILKIRAKHGLPLGYFSDDPESQIIQSKGESKSSEMKQGLISCHRCLIYLGDLARYKGLYGEDDSKARDLAAASGYYMQASSLWPSSGNPHHQLAILASYSGDELVSVYQYFRSLAVENPFSTARDNLIMAFEKNRQSHSQLLVGYKTSSAKYAATKMTRKGRGKGEGRFSSKEFKTEAKSVKEKVSNIPEIFKTFSIRFIRLNGILYTRTSLETFEEVLATARDDLLQLLSSGKQEFNVGLGAAESGIVIVRIIAILIFTVHNAYRKTDDQSCAEVLRNSVLLPSAFTATFEIMGHIFERCLRLPDPSTSYLCSGVLVFLEWLACCPDVAAGSEVEEKQVKARSFFWKNCISLMNELLLNAFLSVDEKEDRPFSNMTSYSEGETGDMPALWEDLELRGFLPLAPAHLALDFSRKHLLSDDGIKEKKTRVSRIISAGKAVAKVIHIRKQGVYFDSKLQKFVIGIEPQMSNDELLASSLEEVESEHPAEKKMNMIGVVPRHQFYVDEEEDEVIVFKPSVSDKKANANAQKVIPHEVVPPVSNTFNGEMKNSTELVPAHDVLKNAFDISFRPPSLASIFPEQHLKSIQPSNSKLPLEQLDSIPNGLNKVSFVETGIPFKHEFQAGFSHSQPTSVPLPFLNDASSCGKYSGQDPEIPSKFDPIVSSGASFNSIPVMNSSDLPTSSTRNPVSRPTRHVGPPPGFSPKIVDKTLLVCNMENGNQQMNDYSWLDGHRLPSSTQGILLNSSVNYSPQKFIGATLSNNLMGSLGFPFPGKQVPEQCQQFQKGNQLSIPLSNQYNGRYLREGNYFV